jgi:hypothetical protein
MIGLAICHHFTKENLFGVSIWRNIIHIDCHQYERTKSGFTLDFLWSIGETGLTRRKGIKDQQD